MLTDAQAAAYVASLRRERAEYVARGLDERIAAVDAELARMGAGPAPGQAQAAKRPRSRKGAETR